jgi:hypothetical protein
VPRPRRIESVFLNIPYDEAFERLYLAYIVGLTQLGLRINAALAVTNQGRLDTIINLIERSDFSIHDLSRIESSRGVPRFNMPVELGLVLTARMLRRESTGSSSLRANATGRNGPRATSTASIRKFTMEQRRN